MMWIALPYPPSVNSLFFNRKRPAKGKKACGRGRTAAYEKWRSQALPLVALALSGRDENGRLIARPWRLAGPYGLTMYVGRPDKRRRDLLNTVKAVEDCLVEAGAVVDDSDCQRATIAWASSLEGVRVLVLPTEAVE